METTVIVGALVEDGDQVLLVEQQGPDDVASAWALPGGRAEAHELLSEALVREVFEETGLQVEKIGGLVYFNQVIEKDSRRQLLVYIYKVDVWSGYLQPQDPDEFILDVDFFLAEDAAQRIAETQTYVPMRDPIVAYLRGHVPIGTTWLYRESDEGVLQLVGRMI